MVTENSLPLETLSEKSTEPRQRRTFFDLYARQWMSGVLILTDLFGLSTALLLALFLRSLPLSDLAPAYDQIFSLLAVILVIKFSRAGLYPGVGLHYIDEIRILVNSISSAFVIVLAVTFLLQTALIYSRLVILFAWLFSLLFIPLSRYLFRRFLIYLGLWGVPVIILGEPEQAQTLTRQLRINRQHGIRPELIIRSEDDPAQGSVDDPGLFLARLKECARRQRLNEALILVDDLNDLDRLVDRYRFVFKRVILVKEQSGKHGLNNLEMLDFSTALGFQIRNNLLSTSAQVLKKLLDVLGVLCGLLLTPFLGLMALAIKLDSPGGVLYRQPRLGKGGKIFFLLKFRTMYTKGDQILESELARSPTLKKEWDHYQKLKDDPRVTRVGRFLRKFSLDELPQLWNTARGEMSLVGPRPILPNQCELYGPGYKDYIQVTPGITGLWQVSGRNQTSFARRAELDLEYIQRWSIWMDVYILAKTVKVVLWQDGAY